MDRTLGPQNGFRLKGSVKGFMPSRMHLDTIDLDGFGQSLPKMGLVPNFELDLLDTRRCAGQLKHWSETSRLDAFNATIATVLSTDINSLHQPGASVMSSVQMLPRFEAMEDQLIIRKVAEPGGWLSNMSPHPVEYEGRKWWHAEALFQALRFASDDVEARQAVRDPRSPMAAKMIAKRYKARQVVIPLSDEDVANMRLCIRLKLESHPDLLCRLLASGDALLVEDCSSRGRRANNLFWGAVRMSDPAASLGYFWEGQNMLGQLWMEERAIRRGFSI